MKKASSAMLENRLLGVLVSCQSMEVGPNTSQEVWAPSVVW